MYYHWLVKGSIFVAVAMGGLSHYTTKASALSKNEGVVVNAKSKKTEDEIKRIEIYDVEAMQRLLEEIVLSNPLYQLNNKSIEEVRNDIEKATITYHGLDMNALGVQDVVIEIVFDSSTTVVGIKAESIRTNIKIEFIDTIAPVIELTGNDVWVNIGVDFDGNDIIKKVTDNSRKKVTKIDILGTVDTNTEGLYEVVIIAQDASGNTREEKVLVHVVSFMPKTRMASSSSNIEDFEYFVSLVNAERAKYGIAPLQLGDENAQKAAMLRAAEAKEAVSHDRPNGTRYFTALDEYGVSYSLASEVLTFAGSSVYAKFSWFMSSPNHRAILLDPQFEYIAVGNCDGMWAALPYNLK
jgi:Uncharacterized protein with SCP/PR1 domains